MQPHCIRRKTHLSRPLRKTKEREKQRMTFPHHRLLRHNPHLPLAEERQRATVRPKSLHLLSSVVLRTTLLVTHLAGLTTSPKSMKSCSRTVRTENIKWY